MANATKIKVSTSDAGVFSVGPSAESAKKASEVLQEDLEKHHIFFNNIGFHSMCVYLVVRHVSHAATISQLVLMSTMSACFTVTRFTIFWLFSCLAFCDSLAMCRPIDLQ